MKRALLILGFFFSNINMIMLLFTNIDVDLRRKYLFHFGGDFPMLKNQKKKKTHLQGGLANNLLHEM